MLSLLALLTPASCCAVPFEENDRDPRIWFLDHSYMESMCAMFKKVNGEHSCCSLQLRPCRAVGPCC